MPRKLLKLLALLGLMAFLALVLVQQLSPPAQAQPAPAAVNPPAATPGLPMPHVALVYTARAGVRLSGTVPDAREHHALLHRARALYGAERVHDALQVQPVANPAWLSPAFLPDLRGTTEAQARLADGTLSVQAVLPDEAARTALARALSAYGAEGLRVDSRLQVQPAR